MSGGYVWDENDGIWYPEPSSLPKDASTRHILEDGELRDIRPVRRAGDPLPPPEQDIELGALLKHKQSGEFYRVTSRHRQSEFHIMKAPFFFKQTTITITRPDIRNDYEVLYHGAVFPLDTKKIIGRGSKWKCRLEFFEGIFTVTENSYNELIYFKDSQERVSWTLIAYFRYVFDPA